MQDPQSLHKYAYVHGDPIGNVDPTGEFAMAIAGFAGLLAATAVGGHLRASDAAVKTQILGTVSAGLFGLQAAWFLLWGYPTDSEAQWTLGADLPSKAANVRIDDYRRNIVNLLKKKALPGIDPQTGEHRSQEDIDIGAQHIADVYVAAVLAGTADTIDDNTRTSTLFGTGGVSGWQGNFDFDDSTLRCDQWCTMLNHRFDHAFLRNHGWVVERVFDSRKYGDHTAVHNFWTVQFRGRRVPSGEPATNGNPNQVKISYPHWILDPWIRGRPDVYGPNAHLAVWPTEIIDREL